MIAKKYRLTENEVRKVISRRKPFFSYLFIANTFNNKHGYARVGIILSSKVARGSVNRNFWRRKFYDISLPYLDTLDCDIVIIPKK
jgi:ribonuclease P protein component